ncbi:MAG: VCBS domain-containing protein [Pseudomonas sp.]|nr:VCBS domain-containing protein [Pseudomonas sp.]
MSDSYQWDFGSVESGLQFTVVFDGTNFTVTCISGSMDLNALWFSDGDKTVEGATTLTKSDSSLNLNGTGITWDDYYKVSSTGLGSEGEAKASYLTAGESITLSLDALQLPPALTSLLETDPTLLTIGVRATSTSSLSGDGKFVDSSGTLLSSSNQAPTLAVVSGGTVTDTAADDTYADVTGQLSGADPDGATVTFALSDSSVTSDGAEKDAGFNVQKSSAYGTFYLNTTSGDYKFVADDGAVEALKTTQTVDFVVHASDGVADSAPQTITITLDGVNDTPELSATLTAHIYTDTAEDDSFTNVTGTLSTADRDSGETATYSIDDVGVETGSYTVGLNSYSQKLVGTYGTLCLNASGAYEFVPLDTAIEALEASTSESFTLKVADGSSATATQILTITLDGAEDKPEVAPVVASYTDTAADDTFADLTGTLSVTSRDGDTSFAFALDGSSATPDGAEKTAGFDLQNTSSTYGTLYLNSLTGAYKFVANDSAIEALQWGSDPSVVFNVTASADGAASDSQTITIDITGANDAPRDLALAAVSFANGNGIPGADTKIGDIGVPAGADPDGGGAYSYSLASAQVGALDDTLIADDATALFSVNASTGELRTSAAAGLAGDSVYEVTIQVSQGTATYSETFSIVTGTNAAENLPDSGFDFGTGDDIIYGRNGADIILAGSGNDTVFGQNGNDTIHGGAGVDILYGGGGNDTFAFASGDTGITLAAADTIADFTTADDVIATSLVAGNVTIVSGAGLADFDAFLSAANAVLTAGAGTNDAYMAYNAAGSGNGWLVIDENDSGSVDAGDSLITLTGVNLVGEFATSDIA